MNRGVLQSSPAAVQQMMMMMGGNPSSSWWSNQQQQQASPFLPPPPFFPQFITPTSSSLPFPNSWHENQELPSGPWSQLLLGGLVGEEEDDEEKGSNGLGIGHEFQVVEPKKFEKYWPQQQQAGSSGNSVNLDIVKQENSVSSYLYQHANDQDFHHHPTKPEAANWPVHHQISPTAAASSPPNKSCVSTNMMDFSAKKSDARQHPPPDRSSECNSSTTAGTTSGGALKKARVQPSATQSTIKVRKEKLGDRITALHQLVSPFGKTDTASVLLEAIGYIRFLQTQIEALSLPYFGSGSGNTKQQQQSLLNDHCMKRNIDSDRQQDSYDEEPIKKDLRSRGLCLVPVSCTVQVGNDNGADYWAPAPGTSFL